jgi:hypothetical protein
MARVITFDGRQMVTLATDGVAIAEGAAAGADL